MHPTRRLLSHVILIPQLAREGSLTNRIDHASLISVTFASIGRSALRPVAIPKGGMTVRPPLAVLSPAMIIRECVGRREARGESHFAV